MEKVLLAATLIAGGLVAAYSANPTRPDATTAIPKDSETAAPTISPPVTTTVTRPAGEQDAVSTPAVASSIPTSGRSETGAGDTYPKSSATSPLVVLQFCLEGCGPCIAAKPNIERLRKEGFAISEATQADWDKFGVRSAPTWIALQDGVELKRVAYIGDLESFLHSSPRQPVSLSTSADDLILCPVCGGHANICVPGDNCGRCPQCAGARVVQLGKHVQAKPDGSFALLQPVKVDDFQVTQKPGGNLIVHNGRQYGAIEHPRALVRSDSGYGICPECRGGGKLCPLDGTPCVACYKCGGSGRLAGGSSLAALETAPIINIRCDPISGNLTSDTPTIKQTGCTDCKCFPECHCGECMCKDAAKKQVSLPLSEPPPGYVSPTVSKMLEENNRIRLAAGKPAQQLDSRLCQAAQAYADLLSEKHLQGHTADGTWEDRARRVGFPYAMSFNERQGPLYFTGTEWKRRIDSDGGEVLCFDTADMNVAFYGWMKSDGHRAALLEPSFDLAGFGHRGTVFVGMFGDSRRPMPPAVNNRPATVPAQPVGRVYTQQVQSCGPNGCSPGLFRGRIFGRRR